MVTKTETPTEAQEKLRAQLREQIEEARERRRQNPHALEQLDELIQRWFDPDVVFNIAPSQRWEVEDPDDEELYGR